MRRKLYFTKENYIIFLAGALSLALGYFLMSVGPHDSFWSLTLSPIVVMFGLVVLFPAGIMLNFRKKTEDGKKDLTRKN
ncbi:MAG: hypothetical protein GQ534_10660 [Candidatus Delongbacteria bacterium]|nr:hypothetical protein [Candidatus Delongbacteria bacterium]